MSYSYTQTETYTRADVAKVFENLEAGICLIARTTKLWTDDYARQIAADITTFATAEYLTEVHIILMDGAARPLRVHEYNVSTDASGWTSHRPDSNIWPQIPDGSLRVVLKRSHAWEALGAQGQASFMKGLNISWGPSSIDTRYPGLVATGTRTYASKAYGLQRTTRERM